MTQDEIQKQIQEAEDILRFAQSEIAREKPGSPQWEDYKRMLEFWGARLDSLYRQLQLTK